MSGKSGRMSLKIKVIVDAVIKDNKHYKIFSDMMLRDYIKTQYKCSNYLTNQVIKELHDTKEKDL
jgi:hypothetical protein